MSTIDPLASDVLAPEADKPLTAQKPGTDIATLAPAKRALVVLKSTETEKALLALIERTKAITAAPVDKAGREQVHRAAMDHKNARLAITNGASDATEDAKSFSKAVSAEAKRLIALNAEEEARLFKLRDEYDAAEAQRKAEEERKEAARVGAIKEKIEQIAAIPRQSVADSTEQLSATLDDLKAFEVTFEDFAEFQDDAKAAITTAIASLGDIHSAAVAREAAEAATRAAEAALAAQREELAKQAAAQAEQQRLIDEQKAALAAQLAELEAAKRPAPVAAPVDAFMEASTTRGPMHESIEEDLTRIAAPLTEDEARIKFGEPLNPVPVDGDAPLVLGVDIGAGDKAGVLVHGGGHASVSLAKLDQPRQRALNADMARTLEVLNEPKVIDDFFAEPSHRIATDSSGAAVEIRIAQGAPESVRTFFDVADSQDAAVEMVTITREEYDRLRSDSDFLACLRGAGVDNWQGYPEAEEAFNSVE